MALQCFDVEKEHFPTPAQQLLTKPAICSDLATRDHTKSMTFCDFNWWWTLVVRWVDPKTKKAPHWRDYRCDPIYNRVEIVHLKFRISEFLRVCWSGVFKWEKIKIKTSIVVLLVPFFLTFPSLLLEHTQLGSCIPPSFRGKWTAAQTLERVT